MHARLFFFFLKLTPLPHFLNKRMPHMLTKAPCLKLRF